MRFFSTKHLMRIWYPGVAFPDWCLQLSWTKIWIWLVVLTLLKNMKVNGKDDIPYISIYEMENKKCLKPPTRNDLPGSLVFFTAPIDGPIPGNPQHHADDLGKVFHMGPLLAPGHAAALGHSTWWDHSDGAWDLWDLSLCVLAQRKHQQMHLAVVLEISSEAVDAHLNKGHKKPRELHRSWQHPWKELLKAARADRSRHSPLNCHLKTYIYYIYFLLSHQIIVGLYEIL